MNETPNALEGKHIFIIEDNLENRIVYQMTLSKYGASLDFERRGRETINRLQSADRVDLIILDLMLRDGVSGFDLFDQIRALPAFTEVPIVAVSAMDPTYGMMKTRAKGFSGFIAKPIDVRSFPRHLAALMNGESVWRTG